MSERAYVVVGIAADTTITIVRESASAARPQGLVLDADHPMTVGEKETACLVLWADTSPERVEVRTSEAGELRMWHVWREGDLVQAWEGEARIVVDDSGDDLGLRCHDSFPGTEVDLVARLAFDRAWTQPESDQAGP